MEDTSASRKVDEGQEMIVRRKIDAVGFDEMRDIAGRIAKRKSTEDFSAREGRRNGLREAGNRHCEKDTNEE